MSTSRAPSRARRPWPRGCRTSAPRRRGGRSRRAGRAPRARRRRRQDRHRAQQQGARVSRGAAALRLVEPRRPRGGGPRCGCTRTGRCSWTCTPRAPRRGRRPSRRRTPSPSRSRPGCCTWRSPARRTTWWRGCFRRAPPGRSAAPGAALLADCCFVHGAAHLLGGVQGHVDPRRCGTTRTRWRRRASPSRHALRMVRRGRSRGGVEPPLHAVNRRATCVDDGAGPARADLVEAGAGGELSGHELLRAGQGTHRGPRRAHASGWRGRVGRAGTRRRGGTASSVRRQRPRIWNFVSRRGAPLAVPTVRVAPQRTPSTSPCVRCGRGTKVGTSAHAVLEHRISRRAGPGRRRAPEDRVAELGARHGVDRAARARPAVGGAPGHQTPPWPRPAALGCWPRRMLERPAEDSPSPGGRSSPRGSRSATR